MQNDDPLKHTPACEIDRDNRVNRMPEDRAAKEAIVEWHSARRAFLAVPPRNWNDKTPFPPDVWNRLANAEAALCAIA